MLTDNNDNNNNMVMLSMEFAIQSKMPNVLLPDTEIGSY